MLPELRDYQRAALDGLRAHARDSPLLVLPCGAGKTVVACAWIHEFISADGGSGSDPEGQGEARAVLFLAHRRELVTQARKRLKKWGIEAAPGGAARNRPKNRDGAAVEVRSVQALSHRSGDDLPAAGLVILDEGHHAASASWRRLADHYRSRGAIVAGMTATPYRLDGHPLGDVFGRIVEPVTTRELCDRGVLVEPRVLAPWAWAGPRLDGLPRRGGDFDSAELGARMLEGDLVGNVVAHWLEHGRKGDGSGSMMRTIGFAASVAHSMALVARFVQAGARARHVDGSTPKREREASIAALEDGELDALWNCALFGEGWDLPSLECAIIARPTESLALHRQILGRVMRACEGKASDGGALVLDHAGNTAKHGLATDEVVTSLTEPARLVKTREEMEERATGATPRLARELPCERLGALVEVTAHEARWMRSGLTQEQKAAQLRRALALGSGEFPSFTSILRGEIA